MVNFNLTNIFFHGIITISMKGDIFIEFKLEDLSKELRVAIGQINYVCQKYNINTKEDVENVFKFVDNVRKLDKYFIIDWKEKE